mgnify:FL=1
MYYDKAKFSMYSQNGEDGILNRLMQELGVRLQSSWSVDVGAYDGISYSNILSLINQEGNAILIEPCMVGGGCEPKYSKLKELPQKFPKVTTINCAVVPETFTEEKINEIIGYLVSMENNCGVNREEEMKADTLDSLLEDTKLPEDYDVLNIDTDISSDHEIWQSHKKYKPKIVVIEINSSISPESDIEMDAGSPSFNLSLKIGNELGYSLVCHTGNMIYVRNDLLDKLSIPKSLINSVELFNRSWL